MKKRLHVFLAMRYVLLLLVGAAISPHASLFAQCTLSVTIEGKDPLCAGQNNGSITSIVTGASANATYRWASSVPGSNGVGGVNLLNAFAGTYELTVTDGNCVRTSNSVTLVDPAAITSTIFSSSVNGYNIQCYGSKTGDINLTVTGGKGPYTYLWNPTGAVTQNLTKVAAGLYTVDILDVNKCPASNKITLTQAEKALDAAGLVTQINCFTPKGSVDLAVVGGVQPYTYKWSNGETTEDIADLVPGNYSVAITDAIGCQLGKAFTITQPKPISLSIEASQPIIYTGFGTQTSTLHAKVSGGLIPYAYFWSAGDEALSANKSNISVTPTVTTTYAVRVIDSVGCGTSASMQIVVNDVVCSKNDNKVLFCILDKKLPYTTHNECVPVHKGQQLLDDQKGWIGDCSVPPAPSTVSVGMNEQQNLVLAGEATNVVSIEKIKITPNPTTGKFEVLLNGLTAGKVEIRILDASGREVERRSVDVAGYQSKVSFDLASKPKGLYFISIISADGAFRDKIIKR